MQNAFIQSYIDAAASHTHERILKSSFFFKENKKIKTINYDGQEYDFFRKKFRDENETYVMIFIGNKKNKCVKAKIKYDAITQKKNNYVEVETYGYYKTCKKNNNNGVMNFFINYIKTNYKKIKKIILTDNCKILFEDNKKYATSYYYFFKYGNFYYSDKYNFIPYMKKKYLKIFEKNRENYNKNNSLNSECIDDIFCKRYLHNKELKKIKKKLNKYGSIKIFLEKYRFENHYSFLQFFNLIPNYYDNLYDYLFKNNKFILYIYKNI